MSDTRKIIDFAAEDNAVAFRDALYSAIHDRVTAHIEAKKQEVAQNLITRNEEKENQVETQEEEFATEEELTEGHHMHTHTVHMADPVSGEWKGKMLMNADNDNHAVRQAKNMAGKHGLKVMKVSKNHVIHSDRTMHEEVIYEGKMDDLEDARREKEEKKASEYKFGPKPKKTLATIRKVAGHSDSGAKRDDKEKDED